MWSLPVRWRTVLAAAVTLCAVCGAGLTASEQDDLAAEAARLAKLYTEKYGDGYTTHVDNRRHLVYVSALDKRTLRKVRTELGRFSDAQRRLVFDEPLRWNVTVVLPTVGDYRASSPRAGVNGYYHASTRTLKSISVSDVLFHEFVHALHHSDQVRTGQRHAVWVTEGLASLLQRVRVEEGEVRLEPGPDLEPFQDRVRRKETPSLADLCRMEPDTFYEAGDALYPHVRYVMFYLHRRDKLKAFYDRYKSTYADDPTGRMALEKTLGARLEEIEAAWRKWLLALEPPWKPAHGFWAYLGVRMRPDERGVFVDGFIPGGPADQAEALRISDVIVSIAGHATPTARDLRAALRACRPGQTVDIEIIRGDRRMAVKQVLGRVRAER